MKGQNILILLISLPLLLVLIGCDADDDNNPSPVPDVRNKFIGEWRVSDACSKANYNVIISKDPSNTAQVLLDNFADSKANEPDTGIVVASTLVLFSQVNSEGWEIWGNGDYTVEGKIEWVFRLTISGYEESCTATYEKVK